MPLAGVFIALVAIIFVVIFFKDTMFPDAPNMICRRCAGSFQINESTRLDAQRHCRFECPTCSFETVGTGLGAFLKFYPRFIQAEKLLKVEGISLVGYGIRDTLQVGMYSWFKEKLHYQCNCCSHKWSALFDPDTLHYKNNPNLFYCPSCLHKPTPKTIKEFFMSLNQIFEGSEKFTHVQWDIFSPLGEIPPVNKIQSKIYKIKFPI